ncbi:MAG TPA: UDP-N-acetylglucosamine 1-carboxyvinyltransferase [Thermoclostridium caenicola]|uniref:UDP-N-acetylglucosamine 1-carboxyvinyltransferase n=1 Tax=Thermoclostridium caenicola TaxID=659425 RepID=UPI002CBF2416|nr:UDP-N-acetylglucosamine 1-carboxyvinyltransferase [Thermoclostridium caenicola]HOK43723.1 UDP-N-acetylglucosamine 1-carboxyvinyltransferase [Thermoclostridium caenicola]HOL85498.1 UDP-N-acetylglucosamine 1-carboxyvinyltransferase [Thermoclostridium caenicola]HPO76569.1 UDP-N-acetylglucosamine 1-carboxyvinyltransferase [Thermoclostridium caenicola]HPU21406.1 UDP-N-acetylglucosamine 1-carboxyvinyltransferase [Thermoclostridium caenicola]
MSNLVITGGSRLCGIIEVPGAKNAVLPVLAATLLNKGTSILENCPELDDVTTMLEILGALGCGIRREGSRIEVDASRLTASSIPEALARKMRSSIIILGALLARCGEVHVSYPGGCEIGLRPIDMHLKALSQMGAQIDGINDGILRCRAEKLTGCEILLDYPSVGATENIMLAASMAEGETIIRNAAKEPEIDDLQAFLRKLGVQVSGAGTGVIRIQGTREIKAEPVHRIIPDRIVAGTYLAAAAATGGSLVVTGVIYDHIGSVLYCLKRCGCRIKNYSGNVIALESNGNLTALDLVRTSPYPGFPTDMQPQMVALLSKCRGTSVVVETVFENRFRYTEQLMKLGADISVQGRTAIIRGVDKLKAAQLEARDLRGGAALVIGALAAEGTSSISGVNYIDRGYERMEKVLSSIGADIKRVET